MSDREGMVPVWFFIGVLLFVYGIIIFITSLSEWSHPPAVVLSKYHPGVWGGIILLGIGGFYTVHFWPGRKAAKQRKKDALKTKPPVSR